MLGWESVATGRYRNLGVAGQSDAVHRGGYLDIDLAARTVGVRMSDDGSGDLLTVSPVLTPGATVGSFTDVGWGWSASLTGMANGANKLWLVDLQDARVNQGLAVALPDFTPNGIAIVFGGIPVSAIPQSGEWRPETLQLGGTVADRLGFHVQPNEQGTPDVIQPAYVPGSGALYDDPLHTHDRTNGPKYMTGKIGQMLCVCIGWRAGKVTGYAFGRLEYNPITKQADKVFDAAAVRAAIGAATSVSVSADLGYTSKGASSIAKTNNQYDQGGPWTATENGTITEVSYFFLGDALDGTNTRIGLYSGASGGSGTVSLVSDWGLPNGAFDAGTSRNYASVSGSIVNGTSYWIGRTSISSNARWYLDTGISGKYWAKNTSVAYNSALPSTLTPELYNSGYRMSAYITYTPAASGQPACRRRPWYSTAYRVN